MTNITTTLLRTKTKNLLASLQAGETVDLIHRSEVVGEIRPKNKKMIAKKFDGKVFEQLLKKLAPLEVIRDRERQRRYKQHIQEKYGKYLL